MPSSATCTRTRPCKRGTLCQAPCTHPPLSSRKSQAFATLQSRFTVAGEMERKSAVAQSKGPRASSSASRSILRLPTRQSPHPKRAKSVYRPSWRHCARARSSPGCAGSSARPRRKMMAMLPLNAPLIHRAQISFMHQSRALQGVGGMFAPYLAHASSCSSSLTQVSNFIGYLRAATG
jgi:hypothetical protein